MEIDQLSIGIETTAKDTISTIDELNKKLGVLATSLGKINGSAITGLANGVNRLSTAMQGMKSVGTADFTRLAKNIEKLGDMNTAGLNTAASSLSHISRTLSGFESASAVSAQIGDMAKNIAKLGNKSVQTAIDNIPKLAVAMDNLMHTLSKSPKVGQNIIDMTKALAALASQGGKVGTASSTMAQSLNQYSVSASKASKHTEGLASKIGRLYATYFWVIRGIKKLWGSIESSFDYLEVLNYFDAAFGQVAENADLSSFEEMGYESAEAYYGSFAKRAEELTAKMSGFTVGKGGLLESTGAVSLGLDPSKLMNYQAMFGQMSSSMGVSSENALKLSQALTEIGADLASVKNLDFETVWNDMASGLAGMSRTLDKYGVNIRNVNLQQKLMELGIDANIQSLNQNDKALLRAIILLENTKYAWGDLADTINQPANQLRLIQANFENLSRTIGNLFLPLVKAVLPYVNALVIAVQRLFAWLGNLIGIDISDISTAIGGADMGDILDQTDDLASGLGDAKKQADKLNKSLRQFDELKVISTKQDDGDAGGVGGIGGGLLDAAFEDAFSKYQQEWDKAFAGLSNRAQEIADKIEKAFEPLKKIIQDFAIGDFFQAGQDTSALVAGIFDFFADAIDRVDWNGIGQKIGDFIAGIDWPTIFKAAGNLMWQALKAAFELYVGAFSSAPLETALVSLVAFPKLLKAITASKFITGVTKIWKKFKVWGEKISLVTGALTGNEAAASGLYMLYPKLSKKVDAVKTAFSNFGKSVSQKGLWKTIDGGITNIRNNLGGLQKAAIVAVAGFAEFSVVSDSMEKLTLGTENWLAEIGKIAGVVAAAAGAMYVALGPAGLAIAAITGVVGAVKGINDAINELEIETMFNALKDNGGIAVETLQNAFGTFVSNISGYSDTAREKLSSISESKKSIQETADSVGLIVQAVENGAYGLDEKIPLVIEKFNQLLNETKSIFEQEYDVIVGNIMGAYADILTAQGIAVPEVVQGLANLRDESLAAYAKLEEQAKALEEQYASGAISADEFWSQYTPIIQKISEFNGNGEIDNATQSLENFYGALDMSKYIDGSEFKLSDFTADMEQFAQVAENGKNSITEFGEESTNSLNDFIQRVESLGLDTGKYSDYILAISGASEEYVTKNTKAIEDAYQQYMGIIQEDLLNQIPNVVEQATKDYENLNWWQKLFTDKGEYVGGVLDKWKETVLVPATTALEEIGVDGADKAREEGIKIIDSLFDVKAFGRNEYTGATVYKRYLKDNWQQILDQADLVGVSAEYGKNAVQSFADSVLDATEVATNAVNKMMSSVDMDGFHNSDMIYGSPSKRAMEYGKWTVEGFNMGISDNTQSTIDMISSYMDKIKQTFSGIVSVFEEIGKMVMRGFESGMSQMEGGLYDKANSIADNITKTIKSTLEIHSPSRVMFRLGDFTMQGFKEGMENLYNPITDSIKAFSYDVAVAPAPSFSDMYGGYVKPTVEYTPQHGFIEYPQSSYNQNGAETNALLRQQNELLRAILAKPNIGGDEVLELLRPAYRNESTRRFGRPDAYDPVLGS